MAAKQPPKNVKVLAILRLPYFRGGDVLQGTIDKPTGKREESVALKKRYKIKWEGKTDYLKYYIVDINEGV